MSDLGRKVAIHIKKRVVKTDDTHAHRRAKAHLHAHIHEAERVTHARTHPKHAPKKEDEHIGGEERPTERTNVSDRVAEALVPSRLVVPKKPVVVEGISMSALSVAYFCMEIGIEKSIPTYAGGLGILAGDMLRSCADLEVPMIGITLLYRRGYFRQKIDASGWQHEEHEVWNPYEKLVLLPHVAEIVLEGRVVKIRAWLWKQKGVKGNLNPIIFLDTNIPENAETDRDITDELYSGDERHRVLQEAVLGIGGIRMLAKLGATNIQKFHMNEGHSSLLTLELYRALAATEDPVGEVRRRCVFTTHTPIAAGHDRFPRGLVEGIIGGSYTPEAIREQVFEGGELNMTRLGFQMSQFINGVAKRHGEVTRELFPGYQIDSITNGVYPRRWIAGPFAKLFDRYIPGWQSDPYNLRYALSIPLDDLWKAHQEAKHALIAHLNERYGVGMTDEAFTIGFARRATAYKRGNMLFSDIDRLRRIAERSERGIQIIYAGKAHPHDHEGKLLIQRIIANMGKVGHKVRAVYVEDYDIDVAKLIVSGVDLWLNTPTRPLEASGTSGMKAALNGVPQFSTLDGWWLEGHIEGVTGWSIGPHPERGGGENDAEDTEDMYTKLEYVILPRFEAERDAWVRMMRQSIAINGSFFNTHRMVEEYVLGAYFK